MATLDDRLESVERQTSALQRDLAVHLTDCMGMHRAIDLKLKGVGEGVESVGQKLDKHVIQTEANLKKLEKMLVLVTVILVLVNVLGTQETIRMLLSLVR